MTPVDPIDHTTERIFVDYELDVKTKPSSEKIVRGPTGNVFRPGLTAASSIGLGPDDVTIVTTLWQEEVDGVLTPYVANVYTDSAVQVAVGLADAFPDDLPGVPLVADQFALNYVKTLTAGQFDGLGGDLWEDIRNELLDGIAQGRSIEQIRDRIVHVAGLTEQRAKVVARTTVHGAVEAGNLEQMRFVGYTSEDTSKEWLATLGDGRTRETHIAAHSQRVRLNEKFTVGGSLLDYPGDPSGAADEVIQCRCTAVYDVDDGPKYRCTSPALTAANVAFHLAGKHNQKSHAGASGSMSGEEFDARVAIAARYEDVRDMVQVKTDDPAVASAINEYGGSGYVAANGGLRCAGGDPDKIDDWYARGIVDGMDKAIAGQSITRDAVVVRGITEPLVTFGREPVVGMEWVDHGFVSTAARAHASDVFTGVEYEITGGMEMRILLPKGTPAMSDETRLVFDSEVVLGRGLRYRIVRDNGEDVDGVRQVDVEVLLP